MNRRQALKTLALAGTAAALTRIAPGIHAAPNKNATNKKGKGKQQAATAPA
jgi:hypothetical protein